MEFEAGFTLEARIIGVSLANDLAMLKVDPSLLADISPVEFGDSSSVRPGQMAVAIGSPFGQARSISVGIIAGINRILGRKEARPIHGSQQIGFALPANTLARLCPR